METKFNKTEIEQLKGILKYHPRGNDAISVISELMDIQELANRVKYPINTFGELLNQMDEQKEFKVGEFNVIFKDMRSRIPAYYFPITCEEDFMDKSAELMGMNKQEGDVGEHLAGEEISVKNAPPMPREFLSRKYSGAIPENGAMGFNYEELPGNIKGKEEQ